MAKRTPEQLMDAILVECSKIAAACRVIAEGIKREKETNVAMGEPEPERRVPGLPK